MTRNTSDVQNQNGRKLCWTGKEQTSRIKGPPSSPNESRGPATARRCFFLILFKNEYVII